MADDILKPLRDVLDWAEKMPGNPNNHSLKYSVERMEDCLSGLLTFAKFKVKDKVQLNETPIITSTVSHGWLGYKDILIKGAHATVDEVYWYKGRFRYMLNFEGSGVFCFDERFLEKPDAICPCCRRPNGA